MIAVWVGNGLLYVTTALAVACIVYYHLSTEGAWRDSEVGWHLMVWMASFALVLFLTVLRITFGATFDTPWFATLRLVAFATTPAVFVWRLRIMVRVRRRANRSGD